MIEDTSPFTKPDPAADMVFVVEEKELHFCKSFLIASSPVFERMFKSEFKEKENNRVPLPDKKYRDMDLFLQQFHPMHSWKPLSDDILETMLRLADEYETEHVRLKCQNYISEQVRTNKREKELSTRVNIREYCISVPALSCYHLEIHRVLFYLELCEQYNLQEPLAELIKEASGQSARILEKDDIYQKLCDKTKIEVLKARCDWLEKKGSF